jgi:signal transduction histidine kinase
MALTHLTGGASSPFVAGFGIEIILSAMTFGPAGTGLVVSGAIVALWLQQIPIGLQGAVMTLGLSSAILLAMGGVTTFLSWRWIREHRSLSAENRLAGERLRALESELEASRTVGEVGENVACLAHSLKNAVHSLRGFASLFEQQLPEGGGLPRNNQAALEGLRYSAGRLEEIARHILSPAGSRQSVHPREPAPSAAEIRQVVDETFADVSVSHPEIRWDRDCGSEMRSLGLPPAALREILLVLLRNAAEATNARGEVTLATSRDNGSFSLQVRDNGRGADVEDLELLFKPGYTTKASGSGYGLFLARRLAEAYGGSLTATREPKHGMTFSVRLPTLEA